MGEPGVEKEISVDQFWIFWQSRNWADVRRPRLGRREAPQVTVTN